MMVGEAKLINEFFVRIQKISTFKQKNKIKPELKNSHVMQWLDKKCLIDIQVSNHYKQLLCYVTKLNVYTVVLRDR